ncbi:MAG: TlpA family protein disulfide reductase [Deltaproteobacteria bacterium]|jgi:thiol-disulfide isomerase/thioredoxin|nr:TlpA family protein disulfide reductase [Deltaproteobacteria bacterium]
MLSRPVPGNKHYRFMLVFAATFVFLSLFTSSLEGASVSDLTLIDMNGNKVSLFDVTGNKTLLLYFWATWCKPCRLATPQIVALAEKYNDRITVIGINVGGVDSPKDVKKYGKRHKITYPLFIDSDNQMIEAYSIHAIPTVILLDTDGNILFRGNELPENLEQFLPK